jgi:hypothetical protein
MMVLRCTARLLGKAKAEVAVDPPRSSGRLGDWYANRIQVGRTPLILCVSERTLLPVLLPASDVQAVPIGLRVGLLVVLERLGVEDPAVYDELGHMRTSVVARTASRRVLGSMTDFAFMLQSRDEPLSSLIDEALWLAHTPCSPIGMRSPREVTIEVLAAPAHGPAAGPTKPDAERQARKSRGGRTWISDMRHYLEVADPAVRAPAALRRLVSFQGSLVERVSMSGHGVPFDTAIPCQRRAARPPCSGTIFGWFEDGAVVWSCTRCGDNGRISDWRGTPWDRTPGTLH